MKPAKYDYIVNKFKKERVRLRPDEPNSKKENSKTYITSKVLYLVAKNQIQIFTNDTDKKNIYCQKK